MIINKTMKNKKPELCENLSNVYKDIISIKIEMTDSFDSVFKKFYAVMRKYGIKQGERTIVNVNGGGEWCMCKQVLENHICNRLMWQTLLNEPPKDLLVYVKKPKK